MFPDGSSKSTSSAVHSYGPAIFVALESQTSCREQLGRLPTHNLQPPCYYRPGPPKETLPVHLNQGLPSIPQHPLASPGHRETVVPTETDKLMMWTKVISQDIKDPLYCSNNPDSNLGLQMQKNCARMRHSLLSTITSSHSRLCVPGLGFKFPQATLGFF